MSSATVEVGEDALESKLDSMTISEEKPSDSTASKEVKHRSPRKHKGKYRTEADRLAAWEEAQKDKVSVATGIKGTVKWYSILGRYGFIERSDGEGDIFVHQSGILNSKAEKCYLRTLAENEEVEFDIVKGKKGEEAINVSGPDGSDVKGAKAFRILLRRPHRVRQDKSGDVKERTPRKVSRKSEDKENGDADGDHADKPKKNRRRRFVKKPASKDNEETSVEMPGEGAAEEARGTRRQADSGSPKDADTIGSAGDAPATSPDAVVA